MRLMDVVAVGATLVVWNSIPSRVPDASDRRYSVDIKLCNGNIINGTRICDGHYSGVEWWNKNSDDDDVLSLILDDERGRITGDIEVKCKRIVSMEKDGTTWVAVVDDGSRVKFGRINNSTMFIWNGTVSSQTTLDQIASVKFRRHAIGRCAKCEFSSWHAEWRYCPVDGSPLVAQKE